MFEKSLYDLIRGLRNHKGNEKEYIQNSLKECRVEIKGQDKDLKATALLKLIYLEMFGHDMSWAAFHVLEVMSSAKYLQKRVGYLGAVQSFRPDTEVLMLATNLLKKDLTSTAVPTLSLPITALPHIVTQPLALSTLQDLLPRMNHSDPAVRKKTIVTIYRLALVYPETLRLAWPKIKIKLMDEEEDSSVTAAIVNVVCELGWRRPQDFLPLAPRLFELLVNGGNNWMSIKLIKLFATLTPLEPRLVRKLLPPLTSMIRTTPAMSLLYECINGIIQGGILGSAEEGTGGEEIASLCVEKLRDMIKVEGDANLKFVALLAFKKIVITHPFLVSQQEDVIMECIDSPDISIRLGALDLVVGMVNNDNLISIVDSLMRQLKDLRSLNTEKFEDPTSQEVVVMMVDSDDESPGSTIQQVKSIAEPLLLPDDYKIDVIGTIIDMCSCGNYSKLVDFEWYINVLVQLARNKPSLSSVSVKAAALGQKNSSIWNISERIGDELRNVAVKVKAVRIQATRAAEAILISTFNDELSHNTYDDGILGPIVWIVGEFCSNLARPESTLNALLKLIKISLDTSALTLFLHALPKIFSSVASDNQRSWTPERKTMISLLMARIIDAFEPLTMHPDLEVQERAVELSELLKLSAESSSSHETSVNDFQNPPLLLTQAIPSLFAGFELNSIAIGAQKNVPIPTGLDLNQPINDKLSKILKSVEHSHTEESMDDIFDAYYHQSPALILNTKEASASLAFSEDDSPHSYQQVVKESYLDPEMQKRRAERIEKNKDDPFYIVPTDTNLEISAPLDNFLRVNNGFDLDINEIPIMQLDNDKSELQLAEASPLSSIKPKTRERVEVAADETLAAGELLVTGFKDSEVNSEPSHKIKSKKIPAILQVDSSHIGIFSLESEISGDTKDCFEDQEDDAEISKAMKEVESIRLGLQRDNERIKPPHGVEETMVVRKKKKKMKPVGIESETMEDMSEIAKTVRKKKKKKSMNNVLSKSKKEFNEGETVTIKKKKKPKVFDDENLIQNRLEAV